MNEPNPSPIRNGGESVDVEITYLEMTSRSDLAASPGDPELRFERAATPSPELGRFLYTAVGGDWHWTDRLGWDYAAWMERLGDPAVETWVGLVGGNPAGYAELEIEPAGDAEIAYFGLLPHFTGRGLGGDLLTRAVERCFDAGAARVWLHTCSLDGPGALPNYLNRGFEIYDRRVETREVPEEPPGPWPGAR